MDNERCIRNALGYAYSALRLRDRFFSPNDIKSAYEDYCVRLSNLLNVAGAMDVRNAEVEAFYTGKVSDDDFASTIMTKVVSRRRNGTGLTPLFALSWEFYSPIVTASENVAEIHEVSLRHLWEIFIRLDVEGDTTLSVDDVVALVLTIFHANGVHRTEAEIGEWFYPHTLVNYISFISALSHGYSKFLNPVIVHRLHEIITTEVLKKGRLTKKGHRVPSWKERFFILKPNGLDYYMEGEDDGRKEQKGSIVLTARSQVVLIPGTKNFTNVFRVEGDSATIATDISASEAKAMREWVEAIKLAIKMTDLSSIGLNILQCYYRAQRELSPANGDGVHSEEAAISLPSTINPPQNHTPSLQPQPLSVNVPQPVALRSPSRPLPNPAAPTPSVPVPAKRTQRPQSTVDSPVQPTPPIPYSATRPQSPPPLPPARTIPQPPPTASLDSAAVVEEGATGSGEGVVVHHIFVGKGGDDYALVDKVASPEETSKAHPPPEIVPRVPKPRKNKPGAAGDKEERTEEEAEGEGRRLKETVSSGTPVVPPPRRLGPQVSNSGISAAPPSNTSVPAVPPRLGKAKVS